MHRCACRALPSDDQPDPPKLSFMDKLVMAFQIFFPPSNRAETGESAKESAKKRLRMILVADRCNMTPRSMSEMKKSIVTAISDYVEVEEDCDVDLSVTTDPDMGTIYSVSVPVKRVKTSFDPDVEVDGMQFTIEDDKTEA
mmetsp:Transcript_1026/g.1877  ORF Transcript_1026/g.1877 Transcript_1026/m.1877 type:complete len:141 (+) Transcript_1026:1110-1532(+)